MLVPTRRSVLGHAGGVVAAAGALPWLVGCGDSGTAPAASGSGVTFPAPLRADQQVTIRFENYNLASAGAGRDATLEMIAAFERKFPNIKVDAKATRDQEIFPSVQAQVVAGAPPDVVQLLLREWDLNVENLPVVPLDELVSPEELRQHLAGKHAFHARAVALTQRKNKTYGLAYVFSTPTLFYNATLFGQAGLDAGQSPQTWEEVAAAAAQIKERTGNDGLYIACIENDWCAQGILLSNGARVMSPDRTKVSFGEPAAVDVYRFWQGLVRSGSHSSLSSADAQAAFQAGKMGMLLQTSAVQGALLGSAQGKFELRSAGMPRFGSRPAVPVNSGSGLGVLSQDPSKRRAAWELVKHLTSEDAFQVITTQIGYLPLRPGMLDDEQYLKNWANRSVILPNIRQLDELQPSLSYPGQNHLRIRDLFLDTLQRVLYRGEDAARSFADAQTRAQALMPPPSAR